MSDKINKKYKDSVFVDLFYEDEKAKENELSLYNALFGTNYTLQDIEIQKIRVDNTVYMNLKNDVSFSVGNRVLIFGEHQSTINGNMPLRDLMYIGRVYEKIVPVEKRYKIKTVKIPRPEFYVFYNGIDNIESESTVKLSSAYIDNVPGDDVSLELEVKIININSKVGNKVLKRCKILNEYAQFVECVREFRVSDEKDYMKKAIEHCIEHHILEEYLRRKGSEVVSFLCAEYNYEMDMKVKGQEKYEDGFEDGFEDGQDNLAKLISVLLEENKLEEVKKLTKDREYRNKLYEKYNDIE